MRIAIVFLFWIIINSINCYYVLPLKTYYDYNQEDKDRTRIMHNLITNNIYTELEIANPPQKLATFIKSKDYCSYIANYFCNIENSNYDPINSNDFNNTTPYNLSFRGFKDVCLANEKMKFSTNYKDLSNLEEVEFKQFYHAPNNTYASDRPNTCGVFGFRNKFDKSQEGEDKCISLIDGLYNDTNLNAENDTQNLVFSIDYSKGELIIGGYPHEYNPSIYKESNYTQVFMNESSMDFNNDFHTTFNEMYFYKNNKIGSSDDIVRVIAQDRLQSIFVVEQNMIMTSVYCFNLYYMYFFRKYINMGYCEEVKTDLDRYTSFICDKESFNSTEELLEFKKTFPTLFLFHYGFNTTFEFTYDELIHENNGRLYFMIYTDSTNDKGYWGIGKLFMEKYLFTFDFGKQSIGYYNQTYLKKEFDFIENGIYVLIIIGLNILVAISCLLYCIIHKCTKSRVDPTIMIDSFSATENLKEDKTEEKEDI